MTDGRSATESPSDSDGFYTVMARAERNHQKASESKGARIRH